MNDRRDDYLYDGRGAPDEDVKRLEELLAPAGFRGGPPPALPEPRRARWSWLMPTFCFGLAAAAALAVLWFGREARDTALGTALSAATRAPAEAPPAPAPPEGPAWEVEAVAGTPSCNGAAASGASAGVACEALRVGQWLVTDGAARARVSVADIGHMDVEPGSRLRLVATGEDQHRLELARGEVHAMVVAPPRLLIVDTPAAAAVDLGCAYTLTVDADGATRLEVTSGWVALEAPGRATYVPAGARARSVPGRGPGLPVFTDAPAALTTAAATLSDAPGDAAALATALAAARPRDTLTLWHLIARVDDGRPRQQVIERIERLAAAPPPGVSRAQLMALEPEALEAWRDALELHW